ncbi:hypothetical protein ARMSODRAFT_970046 [Armillaria solidipes]|uniref:Uncharacterized protein n=1 Tax=Armillaria solidipes TaxID=1076256 RepID=A0A2H3C245_9AGAR|nr:hypothetical protein ARMSODRAFT_970046 [Armillaria solidipes]
MLAPIEYHLSATPEPYESAPTPMDLTTEEYKTLTAEWTATEKKYDEAVGKHKEWKATWAKEAWAEKLRLKEKACAVKLEALRQQELEKEQLQLEAEEKQQKLDLAKKALDDLAKAKEKAKKKEDEENKDLLAAASILSSGEDGNSESDPADLKAIVMAELRKRHKIAEEKKKEGSAETQRCKFRNKVNMLPPFSSPLYQGPFFTAQDTEFLRNLLGQSPIRCSTGPTMHPLLICQHPKGINFCFSKAMERILSDPFRVGESLLALHRSASVVDSGGEDGNVLAGPSVPKHLKTEPEPMAQDKVYTGSECCGKCQTDKATCFVCGGVFTCQCCHIKKVQCTFNKGSDNSSTAESTSVLELLQDISARLTHLENKVEAIADQVEDLVDDYHVDNNVQYPEDFIPKFIKTKFKASRLELWKTRNIYCEVL